MSNNASHNDSHMGRRRHELLSDMEQHINNLMADFNIDSAIAEHCASAIVNHISEHWGGQTICFPKDYIYKVAKRDIEIYDKFKGNNQPELAREYGLGTRAIYKIIEKVHQFYKNQKQQNLFGDS